MFPKTSLWRSTYLFPFNPDPLIDRVTGKAQITFVDLVILRPAERGVAKAFSDQSMEPSQPEIRFRSNVRRSFHAAFRELIQRSRETCSDAGGWFEHQAQTHAEQTGR